MTKEELKTFNELAKNLSNNIGIIDDEAKSATRPPEYQSFINETVKEILSYDVLTQNEIVRQIYEGVRAHRENEIDSNNLRNEFLIKANEEL